MKVEIWSDVMCPFCYIGKKRFEDALKQFPNAGEVKVEWKSFQLNPHLKTDTGKNLNQFLAEHKGISVEKAAEMNEYVTKMAKDSGLEYHLEKAIPANSFDAHRISHLAKKPGVQNELEELLFAAYFTEGKNTADHKVLRELALKAGCNESEIDSVLNSDQYSTEVKRDIEEANQIGVRGVPFFVFDRKYAVSGAQPVEAFLQTMNAVQSESKS
jgi:predicted DsbA family dithiol-disulfide isomerase